MYYHKIRYFLRYVCLESKLPQCDFVKEHNVIMTQQEKQKQQEEIAQKMKYK